MGVSVLLPHFGEAASDERLVGFTDTQERLGFGSVWTRDQVGFRGGRAFESASLQQISEDVLPRLAAHPGTSEA